jgi:hypothetical protein
MIDAVGRRRLYISMSLGTCVVLVCEAVTVAIVNQRSAIAAVFFIFAFEACFTWGKHLVRCLTVSPYTHQCIILGWMATVWVFPAEILPLQVRSKGAALAAAADFLGNYLVSDSCLVSGVIESVGLTLKGRRNYTSRSRKYRLYDIHHFRNFKSCHCNHYVVFLPSNFISQLGISGPAVPPRRRSGPGNYFKVDHSSKDFPVEYCS